jgi:hypothetical protein
MPTWRADQALQIHRSPHTHHCLHASRVISQAPSTIRTKHKAEQPCTWTSRLHIHAKYRHECICFVCRTCSPAVHSSIHSSKADDPRGVMYHGARTVAVQVNEVDGHASRKEATANSAFAPQSLFFSKSLLSTMLPVARLQDDELGLPPRASLTSFCAAKAERCLISNVVEARSHNCEVVELLLRQMFAGNQVMRKKRPLQMDRHTLNSLSRVLFPCRSSSPLTDLHSKHSYQDAEPHFSAR